MASRQPFFLLEFLHPSQKDARLLCVSSDILSSQYVAVINIIVITILFISIIIPLVGLKLKCF